MFHISPCFLHKKIKNNITSYKIFFPYFLGNNFFCRRQLLVLRWGSRYILYYRYNISLLNLPVYIFPVVSTGHGRVGTCRSVSVIDTLNGEAKGDVSCESVYSTYGRASPNPLP